MKRNPRQSAFTPLLGRHQNDSSDRFMKDDVKRMQPNKIMSEQRVVRVCEGLIRDVLPANWNFTASNTRKSKTGQYDSCFTLTSPEQRSVNYLVRVWLFWREFLDVHASCSGR